ncbi:MAG: class I SAM-dependent methyltransferase, partial [Acidobacteria bacterium]|nr:class I SAM-dependent methyltransferase [Acidobacteriota bacterium]
MSAQEPLPGTRPAGTRDEREAARAVREMFTRIAPRYDLLNRVLSLTFDRRWRRRAAAAVESQLTSRQACALDLCCGTADLALELARVGRGRVVGSDFAHP